MQTKLATFFCMCGTLALAIGCAEQPVPQGKPSLIDQFISDQDPAAYSHAGVYFYLRGPHLAPHSYPHEGSLIEGGLRGFQVETKNGLGQKRHIRCIVSFDSLIEMFDIIYALPQNAPPIEDDIADNLHLKVALSVYRKQSKQIGKHEVHFSTPDKTDDAIDILKTVLQRHPEAHFAQHFIEILQRGAALSSDLDQR